MVDQHRFYTFRWTYGKICIFTREVPNRSNVRERLYSYVNLHGLPLKFQVLRLFFYLVAPAEFEVQTFSCFYSTDRFAAVCERCFVVSPKLATLCCSSIFILISVHHCRWIIFKICIIFLRDLIKYYRISVVSLNFPIKFEEFGGGYYIILIWKNVYKLNLSLPLSFYVFFKTFIAVK